MLNRGPTRKVPLPAALIAVIAVAVGCIAPGPESDNRDNAALAPGAAATDDAGGLPMKGDGGGVGTKDAGGVGTKGDGGGVGTKQDSGSGAADGGVVPDAGGMTTQDAGGELDACLACAEQRGCKVQVDACVQSQACMEEGRCDLACLTTPGVPFTGPDLRCVASCSTDWQATAELLAALKCGFHVCPDECRRPRFSCGGDAGEPEMDSDDLRCVRHNGAIPL